MRRLGLFAWLTQPVYVLVEIVIGLRASSTYRFADHTISDLGSTACRLLTGRDGLVEVCSPDHAVMNVAFAYFGCTLGLGALALSPRTRRRPLVTVAVVAWVLAGVGSVLVGLTPVNENGSLHGLVALPVFVGQPLALLVYGVAVSRARPRLGPATIVIGLVSVVGAIAFVVTIDSAELGGLFERLALWPCYIWVGVIAACELRTDTVER